MLQEKALIVADGMVPVWHSLVFILFSNFLFYIGVQPINHIVTVSDEQQMNSAVGKHVSILPQTPPAPIQTE